MTPALQLTLAHWCQLLAHACDSMHGTCECDCHHDTSSYWAARQQQPGPQAS